MGRETAQTPTRSSSLSCFFAAASTLSPLHHRKGRRRRDNDEGGELIAKGDSEGEVRHARPHATTADRCGSHWQQHDQLESLAPMEMEMEMESPSSPEVVARFSDATEPHVHTLFESSTQTWQWIVADPATKDAVIINPVLDAAPKHNGICTTAADRVLEVVQQYGYHVSRILDTHTEREQKTSAWYLRTQLRDAHGNMPRISTGKSIAGVQRMFQRQYRINDPGWGKHFDAGFRDGQKFNVGTLLCHVVQLSAVCFAFVVGHNVFIGEAPQEESMGRLAGYTTGYFWHPGGGDEVSRPSTMATVASARSQSWTVPRPSFSGSTTTLYSPLAPSNPAKRQAQGAMRPSSHIHEMP